MKIVELIEALQKLDPDMQVLLSSDPEGNSYRTLHYVEGEMYVSKEDGYRINDVWDAESLEEYDLDFEDYSKVVVLY